MSCNLVDPLTTGPAEAFAAVVANAGALGVQVDGAELVGLVPAAVLAALPPARWPELDLDGSRTIEARLEQAGLDGGSSQAGGKQ